MQNAAKTLNASGLLQSIQSVIKSQKTIIRGSKANKTLQTKSSYCKQLVIDIKENPLPKTRNVCDRVSIPTGMRKNLFLAMAQYSNFKSFAEKEMQGIEKNVFKENKDV